MTLDKVTLNNTCEYILRINHQFDVTYQLSTDRDLPYTPASRAIHYYPGTNYVIGGLCIKYTYAYTTHPIINGLLYGIKEKIRIENEEINYKS